MDFTTLNAICRTYEHNAKVLHWGACGHKFDRVHNLCDDFEKMFHDDVDFAGETGLRLGQNPPSFDKIVSILENSDHNYLICQFKNVDYDETIKSFQKMFADVMQALLELHESELMQKPANMGIKSEIESVYNKYDFQLRYLNKRRLGSCDSSDPTPAPDTNREVIHDDDE